MLQSDIFVLASLLTFFGTGQYPFKPDDTGDHQDSIDNEEANYSTLSTNQKLLLKPMHEKSPKDRISAVDALALLEKLRPSAGARPIVQGAAKPDAVAKPVGAQPAAKAPVAEKVIKRVDLPKAEPKVPKGIELLPNGARVAGWKKPEKKESVQRSGSVSIPLIVATIFTFGGALVPYLLISHVSKISKHFDLKTRVRLTITATLYIFSFGLVSPFVTWWWTRRVDYVGLKAVLSIQSLLTAIVYYGIATTSNDPMSDFMALAFFVNYTSSIWSYQVIKRRLAGINFKKKSPEEKSKQRASEVTGGHQSWDEVKETFKSALAKHKGSRFIIEILSVEYTDIYFQGYAEPDGAWTIEAAADLAVRPHLSEDQKVKMSMIGWERPSEGLPNFIMFLEADESESEDLAEIFTKSLRDGYGLSITKFRVMAKDR